MSPNLYHVARPLAPGSDRSLGRVAGDLASAGVPVFPCVPGQKRPLTPRGFHDASTDPEQVERWWGRWPDANLRLPTGAVSGVVVVDVDVREDVDGRESMRRALDAGWVGMPVFTVVSPWVVGMAITRPCQVWCSGRGRLPGPVWIFVGMAATSSSHPHTRPLARIGWRRSGKGWRPGSTATRCGSSWTPDPSCNPALLLIAAWLRTSLGWSCRGLRRGWLVWVRVSGIGGCSGRGCQEVCV